MNTAWMFGGVDMAAYLKFRMEEPEQFSAFLALGRERCAISRRRRCRGAMTLPSSWGHVFPDTRPSMSRI
jgi:hypothetical protein